LTILGAMPCAAMKSFSRLNGDRLASCCQMMFLYSPEKHLLSIHLERFRNYTLAIMAFSGVLMLAKAFWV